MYKCLECGHIFDAGEEKRWIEPHGEPMVGCPICGGAFGETTICHACGGEFLEDELFSGYCAECLRDEVTYDAGLDFLKENNWLVTFMVGKVYESDWTPDKPSEKFSAAMEENYRRMKANDILLKKTELLDMLRSYILDDDDDYGKSVWAEWLERRHNK